jgi:hypothetical protein
VIKESWIVIRTEVFRSALGNNGRIEHAAERDAIHIADMDTKTDDATRKLVHDDQYPVVLQKNGFAAEQVNTPKTVLCMTEKS